MSLDSFIDIVTWYMGQPTVDSWPTVCKGINQLGNVIATCCLRRSFSPDLSNWCQAWIGGKVMFPGFYTEHYISTWLVLLTMWHHSLSHHHSLLLGLTVMVACVWHNDVYLFLTPHNVLGPTHTGCSLTATTDCFWGSQLHVWLSVGCLWCACRNISVKPGGLKPKPFPPPVPGPAESLHPSAPHQIRWVKIHSIVLARDG